MKGDWSSNTVISLKFIVLNYLKTFDKKLLPTRNQHESERWLAPWRGRTRSPQDTHKADLRHRDSRRTAVFQLHWYCTPNWRKVSFSFVIWDTASLKSQIIYRSYWQGSQVYFETEALLGCIRCRRKRIRGVVNYQCASQWGKPLKR